MLVGGDKVNQYRDCKDCKSKIHLGYIIVILILLCVFLFTIIGHDNKDLASQLSFGATLGGIILSVIAIIITLIGETKSDNTKDKLLNLAEDLNKIVKNIEDTTSNFQYIVDSNSEIKSGLSQMQNSLKDVIKSELDPSSEQVAATKVKEDFNIYIEIFEMANKNMTADFFRSIVITLYYWNIKGILTKTNISFQEYQNDLNTLGIYVSHASEAWNICFLFLGGDKEFIDYLQKHMSIKYFNEDIILKNWYNSLTKQ